MLRKLRKLAGKNVSHEAVPRVKEADLAPPSLKLLLTKQALNRRLLVEGHSPGCAHSDIYGGTKRFGRARLVVPASRRPVGNQRSSVGHNPPAINIIEAHLRPSTALGILLPNSRYSCVTVDAANTGKDQQRFRRVPVVIDLCVVLPERPLDRNQVFEYLFCQVWSLSHRVSSCWNVQDHPGSSPLPNTHLLPFVSPLPAG